MTFMRYLSFLLVLLIFFGACDSGKQAEKRSEPALKEVFKNDFMIGSAVNPGQYNEYDQKDVSVIKHHFNTITPENQMKWERIHPEPDSYDFEDADAFVEFGEKYDQYMVGHTLVWHSQTPDWVFEDENGDRISREALLERMKNHITKIVTRYEGRVDGWDVVNEALNEDGTLRESPWYKIIGKEYIAKAFEFAHQADPDAELYYNDYSLEKPAKRDGAIRLVKNLKEQGVAITGIGTQSHHKLNRPSLENVENTITKFGKLGLDVMVTELDVDVLPRPSDEDGADVNMQMEGSQDMNPYTAGLPDSMQQQLAERYANLFEIYLKHSNVINRVTFWGVTDDDTWLNYWPIPGRTNYPLLFNREAEPKPAFDAVVNVATQH